MVSLGPTSPLRVLFVEDHADTAKVFTRMLEERGYRVEVAGTCQSALGLACSAHFDLLICDLLLPDGNGCEVLRALREELGHGDLLAIAFSADGTAGAVARAQEAGFDAHVLEPVDLEQLFRTIEEVWRNHSTHPSSARQFISVGPGAL